MILLFANRGSILYFQATRERFFQSNFSLSLFGIFFGKSGSCSCRMTQRKKWTERLHSYVVLSKPPLPSKKRTSAVWSDLLRDSCIKKGRGILLMIIIQPGQNICTKDPRPFSSGLQNSCHFHVGDKQSSSNFLQTRWKGPSLKKANLGLQTGADTGGR